MSEKTDNGANAPVGELWVLCLFGARNLVGRIRHEEGEGDEVVLSPAFDLTLQMIPVGPGKAGIAPVCMPVSGFTSLTSVALPMQSVSLIPFEKLSRQERAAIDAAILTATDMMRQARLAQSGILVTKDMPRK